MYNIQQTLEDFKGENLLDPHDLRNDIVVNFLDFLCLIFPDSKLKEPET